MSSNENDVIPSREVAWRVFASEFDDADFSYAESEEERAPNYVVTPSGARVNRMFVVGVLTEVEDVNEDVVRARIVDPTGAFVVYAGQYQPDALASLESAETPSFVALSGKARTFQPDDADVVYTSIRPESVNEVDADTRDRWVVRTAEQTLDRVGTMAAALDRPERSEELASVLEDGGVPAELASGTALAIDHYDTTEHYLAGLRDLALDAARVVAGEKNEVDGLDRAPDAEGDETVEPAILDVEAGTAGETPEAGTEEASETEAEAESETPEPGPDAPGEEPIAEGPTARALDQEEPEPEASDLEPEPEEAEPEPVEAEELEAEAEESETSEAEEVEEPEAVETDEMQGLTEEERAEVEENFDVGFSTGADIPDQGEADIETPEPEEVEEPEDLTEAEEPGEGGLGGFEETSEEEESEDLEDFAEETETEEEREEAEALEGALEDAVIDEMQALDEGDGADRDELVRTLVESYDVSEDEVADAIQSALMSGRCYESGESRLKAI